MRTATLPPNDGLSPEARRAPRGSPRRAAALVQVALVVAAFGGIAGGTSRVAHAETADPAKAEELIRQANDLRRHGHDERAVPLLRKAYEIAHSARTAGQLGLAEMALGYWVSAETHLNEALAENRNPWVGKNRPALDSALRETQTHLGDLRIEGRPEGAEITVNGSVVGTLPLGSPIRVSEGRVTVEARAAGRKPMSTTVTIAAHASERLQIALESEEPPPPQPTARVVPPTSVTADSSEAAGASQPARTDRAERETGKPSRSEADAELSTWRRVLPWALLGGAAVAGGIGVWQQVSSQSAQTSFDDIPACGAGLPMRGTDPRCQGLYDNFQSRKTHAFIGYGVAGVLGVGAVTLFIVNAASAPSSSTASMGGGQAALALTGDSAFLTYAGRF